jgi:hypothetical protein
VKATPKILIASECDISVQTRNDVSDAIGASLGRRLILSESDLGPDFFDLSTGLAGELFQKLVNYRIQAAIIIPTPGIYGERFAELAYEHANHPTVRIVPFIDDAMTWLQTDASGKE